MNVSIVAPVIYTATASGAQATARFCGPPGACSQAAQGTTCVTCNNADGCNGAGQHGAIAILIALSVTMILALFWSN